MILYRIKNWRKINRSKHVLSPSDSGVPLNDMNDDHDIDIEKRRTMEVNTAAGNFSVRF